MKESEPQTEDSSSNVVATLQNRYFRAMLGKEYVGQNCSVARALEAVGERWTLLIVRELLRRPSRFSELQRNLGLAKNVLVNRLERLQQLGIVETDQIEQARDWKSYKLTAKGSDLFPVINALMIWGDRHDAPNGAPVIVRHACGHQVGLDLICENCGGDVEAANVRTKCGPGWTGPLEHWGAADDQSAAAPAAKS